MAIPPTGGPGSNSPFRGLTPNSAKNANPKTKVGIASADDEAHQAEKDARERIVQAQQRVEEAQRDANARLDQIQNEYQTSSEGESVRLEESVQNQKNQGYEAIRELRRKQQSELNQTRRDGEKDLSQLKNYYNNTLSQTERDGDQKLNRMRSEQARSMAYQSRTEQDETDTVRKNHTERMQGLLMEQGHQIKELTDQTNQQYEKMKASANQAREQAKENFNSDLKSAVDEYNRELNYVNSNASRELTNLRKDTSEKLSAYGSRQRDPFYKLMNVNAEFYDAGDAFVLKATIPEHEQDHVNISIKGDNLVVSGYRRNEEKLDLEPGHTQGTASYQSYYESFPLSWPVEGKLMQKVFDGDELIVRIPKKNEYVYKPRHSAAPEKARVERPKFPGHLPHVASAAEKPLPETEDQPPKTKNGGMKPLT